METEIQLEVQKKYARAAQVPDSSLCCPTGYNFSEMKNFIPQEVLSVSYGCGTPVGLDDVKPGEIVLDIGSGGGIDCFEALRRVGPKGKVIGIDMTDEMLAIARRNVPIVCDNLGYPQDRIEFRKGYAEAIPVEDQSVDLIISNCVINLAPHKEKVFQEMFRILRPGGRFTISDIVADREIPNYLTCDSEKWGQCLSGALQVGHYMKSIHQAGFLGVHQVKCVGWKSIDGIHFYSITLTGYKLHVVTGGKKEEKDTDVFATLVGPFSKAVSELGTLYRRGEGAKMTPQESALISHTPLSKYFILSKEPLHLSFLDPKFLSVRPENRPCVWEGDFAILTSYFLEIEDDDAHIYKRGLPLEICSKTKKVLESNGYEGLFSMIHRAGQNVVGKEVSCGTGENCC